MANGYQSREVNPQSTSGLNTTGTTIAKGTIVVRVGSANGIEPANAAADVILGVAGEDIEAGTYGRVVIRGTVPVIFAAAQTIGARVASNANGQAAAAVAGNAIVGIACEAGAAATLAEVELAGPGGAAMA